LYGPPVGSGAMTQLTNDLVHIGVKLWWQQFLLIFLRTNVIFCTKPSLISYRESNSSHRAVPYEEFFFSWGSCYHCPMVVGAYAQIWA